MGKIKTALAVAGIIVIGGGIYYVVAIYFPQITPMFQENTAQVEEDIVLEESDLFAQFPGDTQMVMKLDFSADNESIINYGLIKEHYPPLQDFEDMISKEFHKNLKENSGETNPFSTPLFDSMDITMTDIWDSIDKSFTVGASFPENADTTTDVLLPEFMIYAEINDPELWHTILSTDEAENIEKIDATHYVATNPQLDEDIEVLDETIDEPLSEDEAVVDDTVGNGAEENNEILDGEAVNGVTEENTVEDGAEGTDMNEDTTGNVEPLTDEILSEALVDADGTDSIAEPEGDVLEPSPEELPSAQPEYEHIYFEVTDTYVTISTYDTSKEFESTLADNTSFKKYWTALPETNLFAFYMDTDALTGIGALTDDPSMEQMREMLGKEHYAMAVALFADELVLIQTSSQDEDSPIGSMNSGNATFSMSHNLPEDTLMYFALNDAYSSYTKFIEYLKKSAQQSGSELDQIDQGIQEVETVLGIDLDTSLPSLFSNESILAIVEVENPVIPVSAVLMTDINTEGEDYKEIAGSAIDAFENSIITIISDDVIVPDKNAEYSFLDNETSYFPFRKFVPDPKFAIGIYHTMDIVKDTWVVASSEEGLQKIYDTANTMIEDIDSNARYKEIADRINHQEYSSFAFIDLYRTYRLLKPIIGAGMSDDDFERFETDINPYLERMHSLYSYSTVTEDGVVYGKFGFVFE